MEHTAQYQLNKWSETDRILMEDFNADNDKLEQALATAGNCKIVTGTYTGTGGYGESNPNTLTFDKRPIMVILNSYYPFTAIYPTTSLYVASRGSTNYWQIKVTWGETGLSWYSDRDANIQNNVDGQTYHYVAIFAV